MEFNYSKGFRNKGEVEVNRLSQMLDAAIELCDDEYKRNSKYVFLSAHDERGYCTYIVYIRKGITADYTEERPQIKVGDNEPYYSDKIGFGALKKDYIDYVKSSGRYWYWVPVTYIEGDTEYTFEVHISFLTGVCGELPLPTDENDPKPEGTYLRDKGTEYILCTNKDGHKYWSECY